MSDERSKPQPGEDGSAPTRFVDVAGRGSESHSREQRAGELLREIKPPANWSPAQLARVRLRLDGSIRPAPATRRRAVVAWGLVGALMLFGSGVVAAARGWTPRWPILSALLPSPPPASSDERAHRRISGRVIPTPAPAPTPEPPPPPTTDVQPAAAPVVPPRIAISAPPRRRPTAEGENAMLERAVAALRQKRDPARALFLLDEYEARFSTGVLAPEAARLRIDALLVAGRRGRALDKLNQLALSEGARDLELALIRGELRSAAGDCARAVADFDRVLLLASDGAIKRRAQVGRAACVGSGKSGSAAGTP